MNVLVAEEIRKEIYTLIKNSRKEVILLLDGIRMQNTVEVHAVIPVKNSARSSFAFIVEEKDFNNAKACVLYNFVGLFHSHKSSNKLSESDAEQLRKTGYLWMIGSIFEEELVLNGFCLNNGEIKEVKIS